MGSPAGWALPKSRGARQGRRPPATRASPIEAWKREIWGRKAVLNALPSWCVQPRGRSPGSRRMACGGPEAPGCPDLSVAWSVSREIRTAPSSNGSAGDRTGGGGRCRLSRRPNPDRGLRVTALGPGLWEVPSWGHRAVRTSPGGPPGPSPPRRRYRSRHLREFPVSPHFGREPRSGRSGNTARPQRFSRNKEADGQPSLSHRPRREKAHPSSPTRSLRGRGEHEPISAKRTHPEAPCRRPVG